MASVRLRNRRVVDGWLLDEVREFFLAAATIAAWSWTCRDGRLAGRSPAGCPSLATVVAPDPAPPAPWSPGGSQSLTVTVAAPSVPTCFGEYRPSGGAAFADEPDYYRRWVAVSPRTSTPPLPAGGLRRPTWPNRWRSSGTPRSANGCRPLQRIAEVEHWRFAVLFAQSSCPFATEADQANCSRFVERVFTRLRDEEKLNLIFPRTSAHRPGDPLERALLTQTAYGSRHAGGAVSPDTPQRGKSSMFDCLRAATDYVADCSFRKTTGRARRRCAPSPSRCRTPSS